MGIRKFRGKCAKCTTRAVAKEMAARREIRYLGLHERVSCLCVRNRLQIHRLLLLCYYGVLLAVSEHEYFEDCRLSAGGISAVNFIVTHFLRDPINSEPQR